MQVFSGAFVLPYGKISVMSWKQIRKRQETERLGPLRLYRDDLEAIAKTLDEFGDLEITVNGEVRCSDPGGFAELGNQLPERLESVVMEAAAGEAMVRVELGQGAKIEVIEPGLAARGAQARIKEICVPRVVRRGWRIFLYFLLFVVFALLSPLLKEQLSSSQWTVLFSVVLAIFAFFSLADIAIMEKNKLEDVILNVPRSERPPFIERLFADRGVSAFWTLVGGVIGYLANQIPGWG